VADGRGEEEEDGRVLNGNGWGGGGGLRVLDGHGWGRGGGSRRGEEEASQILIIFFISLV